jgi:hypothetical protein
MNSKAMIWSTAIVIAMVAVFTILSELSPSVKSFFTFFGSHWIGKSALTLPALGVLYLLFARSDENPSRSSVWWLIGTVVLSGLAIFGFFVWHFAWTA